MNIQRFIVERLHDTKSYELQFQDNLLILVSGNGFGKTTLVNLFYFFISRQWDKLIEYNVSKLILQIDDEFLDFSKDLFRRFVEQDSRISRRYNSDTLGRLNFLTSRFSISELLNFNLNELEMISQDFNLPTRILREYIYELQDKKFSIDRHDAIKYLEHRLDEILNDIQIIYLPTYRRIEKDFQNIFPQLEESYKEMNLFRKRNERKKSTSKFLELVEFGMNDVENKIRSRCFELRQYFYDRLNSDLIGSYLNDILNSSYTSLDVEKIKDIDSEKLENILRRLDNSIINEQGKESLASFVIELKDKEKLTIADRINAHFVLKLFFIYDLQQKEEADINLLVNTCNKYLGSEKEMFFSQDNFKVSIMLKSREYEDDSKSIIEFKDLSSGEKQLISLFTHLILNKQNFYLIIDEPELSLSVPWQEDLLPNILNLNNCRGLLAVTHSPFIFKNGLRKFTHALEEFIY